MIYPSNNLWSDRLHTTPNVGTEHAILLALVSDTPTGRKHSQELALLASNLLKVPTDLSGESPFLGCYTAEDR